ncbi:MAG: alpha/beta hydrolase [Planctomycetota bacterium]|nr:alpha/beta hydrolase [Planctomycetota bacterium]
MRFVFLPGLDGLGEMLGPIKEGLGIDSEVITYPTDQRLGYDDLCLYTHERWPNEDFILIVDSFSGPVAMQEVASGKTRCKALILVSSFARHPIPGALVRLAFPFLTLMVRLRPPGFALRALLLGWEADLTLVRTMQGAIAKVDSSVLAHRFRELATVDIRDQVSKIKVPTLYLQGNGDRFVGGSAGKRLQSLNSTIQIKTLKAPHLILQAKPELALEAVQEFLDALKLGPDQKTKESDEAAD